MKHRKDKFLLGVFLGILMVTMAVLSGCGAKAEPKPDPGSGKYLIYYLNSSLTIWWHRNMKQKQRIRQIWQKN